MNKYVDSYCVEELPNMVIKLVINCSQREIWYHQQSDYSFIIAGSEYEFDNWDSSVLFEVDSFLPNIEGIYYKASMREKDQLYFFYIPYLYDWRHETVYTWNEISVDNYDISSRLVPNKSFKIKAKIKNITNFNPKIVLI